MVGPTRSKLKEAASQPLHSSGSVQCRRRRRITGAGEPETEEEPQGEVEKSELPLPIGRRHLPGGARPYSPRRTRNLNAQKCMQMDMVTKALFLRRFQFLSCYLEQLLNKLRVLRRRQFSARATICIGEQHRPERRSHDPPSLGFEVVWVRLEDQVSKLAERYNDKVQAPENR